MGILVKKPILVAQCGHCLSAEAFWTTDNGGHMAPDLFFKGFPTDGRVLLTNQIIYLACRACQNGLDEVVTDFTKNRDS